MEASLVLEEAGARQGPGDSPPEEIEPECGRNRLSSLGSKEVGLPFSSGGTTSDAPSDINLQSTPDTPPQNTRFFYSAQLHLYVS